MDLYNRFLTHYVAILYGPAQVSSACPCATSLFDGGNITRSSNGTAVFALVTEVSEGVREGAGKACNLTLLRPLLREKRSSSRCVSVSKRTLLMVVVRDLCKCVCVRV